MLGLPGFLGKVAGQLHKGGVVLRMPDLVVLTRADAADLKPLHCDMDFGRALMEFMRLRVDQAGS